MSGLILSPMHVNTLFQHPEGKTVDKEREVGKNFDKGVDVGVSLR